MEVVFAASGLVPEAAEALQHPKHYEAHLRKLTAAGRQGGRRPNPMCSAAGYRPAALRAAPALLELDEAPVGEARQRAYG